MHAKTKKTALSQTHLKKMRPLERTSNDTTDTTSRDGVCQRKTQSLLFRSLHHLPLLTPPSAPFEPRQRVLTSASDPTKGTVLALSHRALPLQIAAADFAGDVRDCQPHRAEQSEKRQTVCGSLRDDG